LRMALETEMRSTRGIKAKKAFMAAIKRLWRQDEQTN